ncbi:uncharacterized protein EV422DRAFT_601477 [Fimicolochytrium jonesii]|uniref:uncharacterized protein n=1 Tax=Fimicolochytrium jonesii TaxID=1396493 RepID=UPI0022FE93B9|nr:uncharacterized protein EV422DRAFT_601477 [Fimicolochytrium jonesii]KAI8818717.1 hypothetical protein EV422DRAFT_601477 [Fimicolochytrium jonesii]
MRLTALLTLLLLLPVTVFARPAPQFGDQGDQNGQDGQDGQNDQGNQNGQNGQNGGQGCNQGGGNQGGAGGANGGISTTPGQFSLCPNSTAADVLQVSAVNLSPNPVVPGQNATFTIQGTTSRPITPGARAIFSVGFPGGSPALFSDAVSMCDAFAARGVQCPIAAGQQNWVLDGPVPNGIPEITYLVTVRAINGDGSPSRSSYSLTGFPPITRAI